MSQKRNIPGPLQALLKLDITLTNNFCTIVDKRFKLEKHTFLLKALEVSAHGLSWIAAWLAFVWIMWSPPLFQMQVNFLIGSILDLILIGTIKAFVRRRRPAGNKPDMFLSAGPDAYTFPSGHVSRAFLVAYFFTYLYPSSFIVCLFLYIWAIAVSLSRVLLRRHYLLDLVGGYALAWLVYHLLGYFWISKETAVWLVEYLTDEKLDGAVE